MKVVACRVSFGKATKPLAPEVLIFFNQKLFISAFFKVRMITMIRKEYKDVVVRSCFQNFTTPLICLFTKQNFDKVFGINCCICVIFWYPFIDIRSIWSVENLSLHWIIFVICNVIIHHYNYVFIRYSYLRKRYAIVNGQ